MDREVCVVDPRIIDPWGANSVSHHKDQPPDIMAELLKGSVPHVTTQENDIIERLAFYLKRLEQQGFGNEVSGNRRLASRSRVSRPKKKATYYLSKVVLAQLDAALGTLGEYTEETARPKVSKSMVVELALKYVLKDLESRGERSRLVKLIRAFQKKTAEEKTAKSSRDEEKR